MSRRVIMIAAIVVIAGYFYFQNKNNPQEIIPSQTSQVESQSAPQLEAADSEESKSAMNEDQLLVENLIKEGIIERIDTEAVVPKVYVTARFYTAPNEDKKAILEVLLKDFQESNPELKTFYLYDAKSQEEVGIYDAEGLKIR